MNDPDAAISKRLRNRVLDELKGNKKSASTMELISSDIDFLKAHLQQTAIDNGYLDFDINNYSGKDFNIDHKVPCSAFYLKCSFHQKLCFHWSNLQILRAEDNRDKSDKLDWVLPKHK